MKVLDCAEQGFQAATNSEEELVRFDVDYLIECLGKVRGTSYRIIGQPDAQDRQSPQPDYLIQDNKTGGLLAVEHARFFEGQESREQHVSWVKKLTVAGRIPIRVLSFPNHQELGKRLSGFVDEKLSKRQFTQFSHCERILLARNRWPGVEAWRFLKAEQHFNPLRRIDCDHFYLIVQRRMIEVF